MRLAASMSKTYPSTQEMFLKSELLTWKSFRNNALAIANDALETAESIGDYALVAKAHFHRAMCFLHKKQLLEAQFGFAIASYDESYRELAELNRQDVESMIDRRQLT